MSCCKSVDSYKSHIGMMPMSVSEIAQAVNGDVHVDVSYDCNKVCAFYTCSDSRQVREGSVFVAIKGERVDGHDYVDKAATVGASVAIVDHLVSGVSSCFPQIVVKDTVKALGSLAKHNIERRRESSSPFTIIGITGSVGKTTTKDMLRTLLMKMGETVAPVGSFNNEIGLPLTALHVGESTRFLVAEMGANHIGEIAYLTNIAPPDIAIVLKVGVAHLGEFGSVERIAQAKSEIVKGLVRGGIAVLNADDARVSNMHNLVDISKVRWFGRQNEKMPYCITAHEVHLDEYGCPVAVFSESGSSESSGLSESSSASDSNVCIHLSLQGEHNIMNALAAANVARYFGMKLKDIAEVLHNVSHISPHRMQVSTVCNNNQSFTLIDDSFNANPDSMKAGIDGLCAYERCDDNSLFRIAVLGSMLELGKDEDFLHENIGAYAVSHKVNAIIAVGSKDSKDLDHLAECIANGALSSSKNNSVEKLDDSASKTEVFLVHDTIEADKKVWSLVAQHSRSVVLLKGSHASGLSALAEKWDCLQSSKQQEVTCVESCSQMEVKR